jgi:hypothetical protein
VEDAAGSHRPLQEVVMAAWNPGWNHLPEGRAGSGTVEGSLVAADRTSEDDSRPRPLAGLPATGPASDAATARIECRPEAHGPARARLGVAIAVEAAREGGHGRDATDRSPEVPDGHARAHAEPGAIDGIGFATVLQAREIDMQVIAGAGARAFEVERADVDLGMGLKS